ncbi:hypothetical protein NE236_07455 [Actinoallomurus purpureus]|uniref:hypothetical protein n=1 Tax=Actinoallomurus purpureus TaxID=478114 RepID=UPI00209258B6|nr:hypothetical protein [Actinoallomurus purpureus]MCO6004812.1 hypothetical protein [Actinoallomurus purpureus]
MTGLAVASGLILTMAPSAAASSGGGCRPYSDRYSGWKFRACISAHKNVVRPDFYVDRVGQHDRGFCRIDVALEKADNKKFTGSKTIWRAHYGCKQGHVPYSMKTPRKAHGYYRFWVMVHNRRAYDPLAGASPVLHN